MVCGRDRRLAARPHECGGLLRCKGISIGLEDPLQSDLGRFVLHLRRPFFVGGFRLPLRAIGIGCENESHHEHDGHHDQKRHTRRGLVPAIGMVIDRHNPIDDGRFLLSSIA
jgi:hypothetical protein